ncbi:MAG: trypsin-like peptidase domain-containing protein [Eubacterium sp.]|nr:trypsin-like peptidase domain-containing protein [Eubacterium sp.]
MNYDEWKEEMNRTFSEPENSVSSEAAEQPEQVSTPDADHPAEGAAEAGQAAAEETPAEYIAEDAAQAGQAADAAQAGQAADANPAGADTTAAEQPEQSVSEQMSAEQNDRVEPVTYSWVNPKLQTGRNRENMHAGHSDYQWRASDSQGTNTYTSGSQSVNASGSGSTGTQGGSYSDRNSSAQYTGSVNGTAKSADRRVKRTKSRKPAGAGSRWMRTIAMALVFGLVAGVVMFGVNRAGNALFGSNAQKADTAAAKSYTKVETTKTSESSNLDDALDASTKTEGEQAYAGTVAEVASNAMPSLVTISTMSVQEMQSFFGGTQQYEVEGAGTGVIVGQNDTELLIATNDHVVDGATEVTVGFIDEQAVEAYIKGTDPSNDLAVVGVKLEDIPQETLDQIKVVAIGNSDDLVLGEQVVVIGNALGIGQSVTSGYISGFDRELELADETGMNTLVSSGLIQTDAAINAGNSGGALLNMRGELVGINEAKSSSAGGATVDNVGYSIPISKAEPILQELMTLETKDKVSEEEKGYLGIRCADVNQETSQRYNIPVGVYVREIGKDSPAAEAGLIEGDVITKIDGKIVSQYADLEAALDYCKAGETIEVIVQRQTNGSYEEQTLSVTLGKQAVLDNLSSDEEMQRNMQTGPNGD